MSNFAWAVHEMLEQNPKALDRDGVTPFNVIGLYRQHFWQPLNCDALPQELAIKAFIDAVNHGVKTSAKMNNLNIIILDHNKDSLSNVVKV